MEKTLRFYYTFDEDGEQLELMDVIRYDSDINHNRDHYSYSEGALESFIEREISNSLDYLEYCKVELEILQKISLFAKDAEGGEVAVLRLTHNKQ